MNPISIGIAALVLAASASAQSVTFNGKVEDVSGTQNQFFVDCTDTRLTSTAFNLNLFVGQQTRITGTWNGSAANPSVNVTDIQVIPEVFELGGGAKIGGVLKVGFIGTPGDLAISRIALQPGFAPIDGAGVLFLDMSTAVAGTSGIIPGGGILQTNLPIPNNPALIGLEIYGQGATITPEGVVTVTNPDCKTLDD